MPRGDNQYNSPTVQKAIEMELEAIKDLLGKAHPKGLAVKDLAKKFHDRQGYKLAAHTVQNRLNVLIERDEVHVSIQKGKYGAKLFILGPDPAPIGVESQPVPEPPLSSDELLSFMHHMEGIISAKLLAIEKKLDRLCADLGITLD